MTELPWWFWVFIMLPLFVIMFSSPLIGRWLQKKGGSDDNERKKAE